MKSKNIYQQTYIRKISVEFKTMCANELMIVSQNCESKIPRICMLMCPSLNDAHKDQNKIGDVILKVVVSSKVLM